jgi:hypothetical protein
LDLSQKAFFQEKLPVMDHKNRLNKRISAYFVRI